MTPRTETLISVDELRAALDSDRDVVLLDVRFESSDPGSREGYREGHLPGAHFVDLTTDLQEKSPQRGARRPLPAAERLQGSLARWGVDQESLVVVYSEGIPAGAGRAWFVLKWAGVPEVRVLDGGLDAWVAAEGELTRDVPEDGHGTFEPTPGRLNVIDADRAQQIAASGVLLDARSSQFYTGAATRGEERSGHIPGAVNTPIATAFDGGYLKSERELVALFAGLGLSNGTPKAVYCGGGVAAGLTAMALSTIDIPIDVYIGSWSDWESQPERPTALGPTPAAHTVKA
ncbi:MAG TPA: sulfurtransferase [Solirubrobacterales bacterium]|nr:sulfurtransferase [Solirubrobacterales bacterium]